ncbi:MAG: serine/threonine protein kinase [Candidatus Eisenbacteria bacterium]|uniref:Serine/threonine protein kinase n=1 Tax=Eiseniibacteriota bacterium TaxID=2212470 RepID=A0A956SG60_UNCEI|nr:serine/threonine protein kinase [Candidatus Eisenbacteria bacterium]
MKERDALPSLLRTAGSASYVEALPSGVPETVGPYRLLSRLGEGGMGAVYLAEQSEPIERRVALKLIKPGLDTEAVIARFESERQTLARLHHPNIAQVYDAGSTDRGHPFFAMEYVPGVDITRYCDLAHLDVRARVELMSVVCAAIQHAHQRGVIHRDIKPSNILVATSDDAPRPMVIDFGIAKATERKIDSGDTVTLPGQLIGTPEYMSPEQADPMNTDIDVTTDVYSLGAVLYELLTGTRALAAARPESSTDGRPFDGRESLPSRERSRSGVLPSPPSRRVVERRSELAATERSEKTPTALARALRGELDWITLRALDPDRSRRYQSAAELEEELARYLRGEPVEAGPPSMAYRFRKLVARHRTAFVAGASVLLVLATGLVVSTTLYVRSEAAHQEASRQARKAERVNQFLQSMLQSADPEVGDRDVTVREVLENTAASLEEELSDEPEVLAAAQLTLGNTFDALGQYDEAISHMESAVSTLRVARPAGPELAQALNDLGIALVHAGRYERADSIASQALSMFTEQLGADAPQTSTARTNLAVVYKNLGRFAEAERLYRETLAIHRAAGTEDPEVATLISNLAVVLRNQENYDEAIDLYRNALEMLVRTAGSEHHMVATVQANLAAALSTAGRYDEALPVLQAVLERDRDTLGEDHPYVAGDLANLAVLYRNLDELELAEESARASLEVRRQSLGANHPYCAKSLTILGSILTAAGQHESAEDAYREALQIRREHLSPSHPSLLWSECRLGQCLLDQGRRAEAEPLLVHAWEEARGSADVPDSRREQIQETLASLYDDWKPDLAKSIRTATNR